MVKFNELNIEAKLTGFIGKKIEVEEVLGKEITLHHYAIGPSKFINSNKGNGKRLTMQITFEGKQRIIFSGSVILQNMIEQIPPTAYPVLTTIILQDKRLQFT